MSKEGKGDINIPIMGDSTDFVAAAAKAKKAEEDLAAATKKVAKEMDDWRRSASQNIAAMKSTGSGAERVSSIFQKSDAATRNLAASGTRAAKALGPLGGVMARLSPEAGAAASSVAGLTSGIEGLGAAGIGASTLLAVLGPLAVAAGVVAAAFVVQARETRLVTEQQALLTAEVEKLTAADDALADASLRLALAKGEITDAQAKAIEGDLKAGRAIRDFTAAQQAEIDAQQAIVEANEASAETVRTWTLAVGDGETGLGRMVDTLLGYSDTAAAATQKIATLTATQAGFTTEVEETARITEEAADAEAKAKAEKEAAAKAEIRAKEASKKATEDAAKAEEAAYQARLFNIKTAAAADKAAAQDRQDAGADEMRAIMDRQEAEAKAQEESAEAYQRYVGERIKASQRALEVEEASLEAWRNAAAESTDAIGGYFADLAMSQYEAAASALEVTTESLTAIDDLLAELSANQVEAAKLSGEALVEAYKAGEVATEDLTETQKAELTERLGAEQEALTEQAAAEKAHAQEQFAIQKGLKIAAAAVATALAIINSLANTVLPYPASLAGPISAAAVGAVSIASIAAEQPTFDDTPGVMKGSGGPGRTNVSLASDDFFAASKTPAGLAAQVGGGGTSVRIGRIEAKEIIRTADVGSGAVTQIARKAAQRGGRNTGLSGRRPMA